MSFLNKQNIWGVLDNNGNTAIDFTYEKLGYAGDGLIPFMKYQKWGYIDYKGNVVIEPQYKEAYGFSNGLAAVTVDNKMGFINTKNEMVIAPNFTASKRPYENRFLDNGLAVVYSKIIDRKGNVILSNSDIYYNGGNIVSVGKNQAKIFKIEGLK